MNTRVEQALNDQIEKEASSSQFYLAMASWAENNGMNGTAKFMYQHSDEERFHMLKLVKFVNERGGKAIIPAIAIPPKEFKDLTNVFELLLNHEIMVTESINNLVDICLQEKISRMSKTNKKIIDSIKRTETLNCFNKICDGKLLIEDQRGIGNILVCYNCNNKYGYEYY